MENNKWININDNFIIRNNEWISFNLIQKDGVFYPEDNDVAYALFYDILKSNKINYVVWIKNEYFFENAFYKEDVKSIQFLLNNNININHELLKNKYFVNDTNINTIFFNISFEFLKRKDFIEDDEQFYSFIFFNIKDNKIDFSEFDIYSIESDMEISVDNFLIFNSYTTPLDNKKEALSTLFKLMFNEDYYVDINFFELKMKEFWLYDYFTTIMDNSISEWIIKKKYDNMYASNSDLFIINEVPDNIKISDLTIKENFWYSPYEIYEYFNENLTDEIKQSEYYIHSLYLWYLIININNYYLSNSNINMQTILFLTSKNNINIWILHNILYPTFEKFIVKITNNNLWKNIFCKYVEALKNKI